MTSSRPLLVAAIAVVLVWGLIPYGPDMLRDALGGVASAADDPADNAKKPKKGGAIKGVFYYDPSGGQRNKACQDFTTSFSYKGNTLTYYTDQHNKRISTNPLVFLNKTGPHTEIMIVAPRENGKGVKAYYLFAPPGQFPKPAVIRRIARGLDEEKTTEHVRHPTAATFRFFARAFRAGGKACGYTVEPRMKPKAASSLVVAMGLPQPPLVVDVALEADPWRAGLDDEETVFDDLVAGLASVSLTEARAGHTATTLPDGRVLVVGNFAVADVSSAEIWDPATGEFTPAGFLAGARQGHTATALPDGRVLVVGGSGPDGGIASAEVWDSATGGFTPSGSLALGRSAHTATALPDGRVLVVGGSGFGRDASAEVWDPATGEFTSAGSLAVARTHHTATALADGRVLVVGGWGPGLSYLETAEVWDPATGQFTAAGSLAAARTWHTATGLPDGRVLVVGGSGPDGGIASAETWDLATGEFTPAGSLAVARRSSHTATALPDGRVLVAGGLLPAGSIASTEAWDPATGEFTPATSLTGARSEHTATALPDGSVLVVGGLGPDGTVLATAEVRPPSRTTSTPDE